MRPAVGTIIRLQHHAYRVLEIREQETEPQGAGTRFSPYELVLEKLTGEQAGEHFGAKVNRFHHFREIGEHYPVCNKCGEVPPCREQEQEDYARRQAAKLEKALRVPPGACPACSEVITHKQRAHHFPGPNLLNPLAPDGVTFHARRACASAAARYEETWVAADPTRERSLLTLRCEGTLTIHGDGTAECQSRNDGSECPTVYADHKRRQACYFMSHGCPRDCSKHDHPGIRIAPNLTPEGYSPKGLLP